MARRNFRRALIERLAAPILAAGILLLWQAAVAVFGISEFILPSPWAIISRIYTDFALLAAHTRVTMTEVVGGFGLAALTGVPFALAIFYSRIVEKAIYPLLVGLQTIPKVALAPLLVLYLGYGWAPKIFLAFLISFFPIVISTVVGLQSLDKGLVHLVRSMGASEHQTFWKIRLPAALPSVFGGFKVGVALAVIGAVIGEYVASERGLGYMQMQATSQFDTTLNFASVVVISLVGVVLYFVLAAFEARLVFQRDRAR
ncbi:MAG: ABC transporter permease [Burkholderiales bacterium]